MNGMSIRPSQEILFARKATFIAATEGGNTIVYRLVGKAPGITGQFGDDILFVDALTGKEKRRAVLDQEAAIALSGRDREKRLRDRPATAPGRRAGDRRIRHAPARQAAPGAACSIGTLARCVPKDSRRPPTSPTSGPKRTRLSWPTAGWSSRWATPFASAM